MYWKWNVVLFVSVCQVCEVVELLVEPWLVGSLLKYRRNLKINRLKRYNYFYTYNVLYIL